MFDVGISELLLIGLVALIVLGPERLPKAARFAGLWVRRARAQWYSVKGELERELAAEELQRSLRETREAAKDIESQVRDTEALARREFERMQAQMAGHDPDIAAAVADSDAQTAVPEPPSALPSPTPAAPADDTPQGDRDGRG
ncbi:Sec-independent protein translocase protein TatB [Lysobacter brunescens]|uniref:Sec-independent protein translocase protein TatB n=1 Tax=Lysobacter brunescens TaxID=262323 RepID=A0ABW2YAT8_9GAMM